MEKIHREKCPICGSEKLLKKYNIQDFTVSKEYYELVECSACNFIFTQDAPSAEEIGPYYKNEDYVSHSDTQKGLFFKIYHIVRNYMLEQKRKAIVKHLDSDGKKILDIGAATGHFLNHMQKNGFDPVGIEQDKEVREKAEQTFGISMFPTEKLYEFSAQTFDVITLWHVLEHVHDLDAYLKQIKKILKPNGLLLIALPNRESYDAKKYKEYWAAWDIPIHLWHFSPNNIRDLLKKYQLKLHKQKALPFDAFYVSILSAKAKQSSFPFVTGGWNGLSSFVRGLFNVEKNSSLIYFFKHQ